MSVLNPRNRLVNFRLSQDEFESLRVACSKHGARSVSDFARGAVLQRLEETPEASSARLHELNSKVGELETRVEQLLRLVTAVSAEPQEQLAGAAVVSASGYPANEGEGPRKFNL